MKKQQNEISGFTKKIATLHKAILMGPIALGIIFFLLNKDAEQDNLPSMDIALLILPIIAIGCVFFGNFLFKKIISKIPKSTSLKQKLHKFRTAFIIKLSLIEGPALASTLVYHITLDSTYLMMSGALALYMILIAPKKENIATSLNLQGEENARFNRYA